GAGRGLDDGRPRVAPLPHARMERDLTEQGRARELGDPLSTARAEELVTRGTTAAYEVALVLHDAEHGDPDFVAHRHGFVDVLRGHLLWRRHDHGAGGVDLLRERERDVARPG